VFVFFIGDRFFGTMTAYVPGREAAGYGFTSSLPVQILKIMAPTLKPMIEKAGNANSPAKLDQRAAIRQEGGTVSADRNFSKSLEGRE